jgi:hypothetical protein
MRWVVAVLNRSVVRSGVVVESAAGSDSRVTATKYFTPTQESSERQHASVFGQSTCKSRLSVNMGERSMTAKPESVLIKNEAEGVGDGSRQSSRQALQTTTHSKQRAASSIKTARRGDQAPQTA